MHPRCSFTSRFPHSARAGSTIICKVQYVSSRVTLVSNGVCVCAERGRAVTNYNNDRGIGDLAPRSPHPTAHEHGNASNRGLCLRCEQGTSLLRVKYRFHSMGSHRRTSASSKGERSGGTAHREHRDSGCIEVWPIRRLYRSIEPGLTRAQSTLGRRCCLLLHARRVACA